MKRKKRKALPRLTLLAYSLKDLARFNEDIEALKGLAQGMEAVLVRLEALATRSEAARRANANRKGKSPTVAPEAAREAARGFTGQSNGKPAAVSGEGNPPAN